MKHSTLRRLAGAALVTALVGIGPAAMAADSSSSGFLQVRSVNALDPAKPVIGYFDANAGKTPTITENGKSVTPGTPTPLPDDTARCNAVVLDTSSGADTSGSLVAAKASLKSWVQGRSPGAMLAEQFGIYAANDVGVISQPCTADTSKILAAIDQVAPPSKEEGRDKTAMWAAVRQATADLNSNSDLQPNLIIMSSQADNASKGEKDAAVGGIASSNTPVFGLAYTGNGYSGDELANLSGTYGGELLTTDQGPQMGALVSKVQAIIDHGQFTVAYPSTAKANQVVDLSLASGGLTTAAVYTSGTSTSGYAGLTAAANKSGTGGVSILQGNLGLLLAVLLVLVAVAMAAYGIMLLVTRDNSLNNVLQPYSEGYGPQSDLDEEGDGSYAKTAIIQRAVEVTEQFADSQGYLARAESALERANLPLRAGEALFFYAAVVIITTILAFAIWGLFVGLILGMLVALIPIATVSYMANRRRKKFLALLPDTLQLLSGTLRAGYSLMQGVEAISQEVDDPMGQELRRVVTESRLGRPLEESLEGVAERMDSPDFSWTVMAIRIQREVGGNLSELLLTVADTMTQRERLRRDVAALTAEGRISALVLACLPIGLGIMMYVINPVYMSKLFNDTLGNIMLGLAILGMVVGFLWMKKIINIEI